MNDDVKKIGTTDLWMGALGLGDKTRSVADLQAVITRYVEQTSATVTGCYMPECHELLLLHWPETRSGYAEHSVTECDVTLHDLAEALHAEVVPTRRLGSDQISCMMGRKVDGYDDGRIAELSEISQYQ